VIANPGIRIVGVITGSITIPSAMVMDFLVFSLF
jgi:hypothetical protein